MDGNQKHLTELKMAEGHFTKCSNYCMYILDPVGSVSIFRRPMINSDLLGAFFLCSCHSIIET